MHALFGTKHLILIAISAVIIVVASIFARKLQFKTVVKILFVIGLLAELVKDVYFILANEEVYGGTLPKSDLPFHLCSIQMIFVTILLITKSEKVKKVLISFMRPSCLFGGICAILIATYSARNSWVITVQYFTYHIALTVFAIYTFMNKEFKMEFKDYVTCLVFLGCLLFVAIYINSILTDLTYVVNENGEVVKTVVENGINFMYVSGPPQSGLPYLTDKYGWGVYICHYAGLIIFCVTMVYIKPVVCKIKSLFAKKSAPVCEDGLSAVAVTDSDKVVKE